MFINYIISGVTVLLAIIAIVYLIMRLNAANSRNVRLQIENTSLHERLAAATQRRQEERRTDEERFRNLASEIFHTHTARFKQSSEQRLDEILAPLKADIEQFRAAVINAYDTEAKERFSLRAELRRLMEHSRKGSAGTDTRPQGGFKSAGRLGRDDPRAPS